MERESESADLAPDAEDVPDVPETDLCGILDAAGSWHDLDARWAFDLLYAARGTPGRVFRWST